MPELAPQNPLPRLRDWIRLNLWIGGASFGGTGRVLLYQDEAVDRKKWITDEEFQELYTLAQVLPGPNLVNTSVGIGSKFFGPFRNFAGAFFLLIPGPLIAVFIANQIDLDSPRTKPFIEGLALGSVTIFFSLLVRFAKTINTPARFVLATLVALGSAFAIPISAFFGLGMTACLVVEFFPRHAPRPKP